MALSAQDVDDVEFTLLNKRQAKVYQIPPAASAAGHRAEDWKESIWIGRCRIVGKGSTLYIKLLDSDNAGLFAQCIIPNGDHEKYVERTVDSSRYFVLKITNDQRHAFIGFGFSDRNDAFDFVSALDEFKAKFIEGGAEGNRGPMIAAPSKDLSLKEGETITVNLKGLSTSQRRTEDRKQNASATNGSAAVPLLMPPPSIERTVRDQGSEAPKMPDKESSRPLAEFRPVPEREGGSTRQGRSQQSLQGFSSGAADLDGFADFQSASGGVQSSREPGATSTGQKSFVEYLLPAFLIKSCTVDTRTPDHEF